MTDPMTVSDLAVQDHAVVQDPAVPDRAAIQDRALQDPAVQDIVGVPALDARLTSMPAVDDGAGEGCDDTADDAVAVAEARVSTVLDGLAALADASPDEQVEAFAAAQRTLRATLSDIDNG